MLANFAQFIPGGLSSFSDFNQFSGGECIIETCVPQTQIVTLEPGNDGSGFKVRVKTLDN